MLIGSKTCSTVAAVLWFLLLGGREAHAAPASRAAEREALQRTLTDILARGPLKDTRASVEVRSLGDDERVFSHRADDLLNPASNVKLFTAAAALARLGPEYRFETELLVDASYAAGKAKALYVRGKGDPTLTTERLYNIVSELFHAGLREVTGELVVDDSWFDAELFAPGYDQDSSDRAYKAPTGAVSLNWNTVGVYLRPAEAPGRKAVVELEPPSDFFLLENSVQTSGRRYHRFTVNSEPAGDRQRILVRGVLPVGGDEQSAWRKIDNPAMYFGHTLRRMLADRGIKVRGNVRRGATPENAKALYTARSETFDLVLKRLNKHSSNFVAETLIKTLGAEGKGPPGSFAKGIEVVEEFLAQAGIPRGTYVMKNGSGLNDTNRFSASQINRLLRHMYLRFPLASEYLSSICIAGKDGTLRYRFEGSDAEGRLRAKTGTLEDFASLALSGYVQSLGGETFTFSILINDFPGRAGPIVQGIDALGVAIASSGSQLGPAGAVAEMLARQVVVSPLEEAKARIRTYLALGNKKGDSRNASFLRTAWRNEKDPAVRAVVAEALYRSDPQGDLGVRALLSSIGPGEDVYGRLRRMAREMSMEVPGIGSVVELAAEGNTEALAKVLELASAGDESAAQEMADFLSEIARTAPEELVRVLHSTPAPARDVAATLLARGLARAADPEHPFWPALRKAMGAVVPGLAAFARELDDRLASHIARERAPKLPSEASGRLPEAHPAQAAETRSGG